MAITEKIGVFKHVDDNGNVTLLYPAVKTDPTLTEEGSPADAAAVAAAIEEVKNSAGDAATVRYNTETDMIQLLYENAWHDWKKAGFQLEYLFTANNNAAGFAATSEYSTSYTRKLPRLSVGEKLVMSTDSEPSTAWVIISQPVNVDNYTKLCMNHKTYFTGNSSQYDNCHIWIVDVLGESPLTPLALNTYMDGTTKTLSGILELDVSGLSGEIHVAIQVNTNNCDSCTVEISEMWLE